MNRIRLVAVELHLALLGVAGLMLITSYPATAWPAELRGTFAPCVRLASCVYRPYRQPANRRDHRGTRNHRVIVVVDVLDREKPLRKGISARG
jgi:hypothetical protein